MPKIPEQRLLPTYLEQIGAYERIVDERVARDLLSEARNGSHEAATRFVHGSLYRAAALLPNDLIGPEAVDWIQPRNEAILTVLSEYEGALPLEEIDRRIREHL